MTDVLMSHLPDINSLLKLKDTTADAKTLILKHEVELPFYLF